MRIVIAVFCGLVVTGLMVVGGDWAIGRLAEESTVQSLTGGANPIHAASLLWKAALFNFAALLLVIPAAMLATRITPRRQPAL